MTDAVKPARLSPDELELAFLGVFASDTNCKVTLSDTLEGLDLDSLDVVELTLLLEDTLQVDLTGIENFKNFKTPLRDMFTQVSAIYYK